jgi:hypothetical protein
VGSLVLLGILCGIGFVILVGIPAATQAKMAEERRKCDSNLRGIGIAFKTWGLDHGKDGFPFNLSASAGGTLELCKRDTNGVDANSLAHFLVVSNEITIASLLLCPSDGRWLNWTNLTQADLSYHLHTARLGDSDPQGILAYCPRHHLVLSCDGIVGSSYKSEADQEKDAVAADAAAKEKSDRAKQERAAREQAQEQVWQQKKIDHEVDWVRSGLDRTWTYKTGQTVKGKFVAFQGTYLLIRKDFGRNGNSNPVTQDYAIEIQKLVDLDQKIAARLAAGR